MKLTPELKEIALKVTEDLGWSLDEIEKSDMVEFASLFLAALPNSEPVARAVSDITNTGYLQVKTLDSKVLNVGTELYAAPTIPQYYKAQLAESHAEIAKWKALSEANLKLSEIAQNRADRAARIAELEANAGTMKAYYEQVFEDGGKRIAELTKQRDDLLDTMRKLNRYARETLPTGYVAEVTQAAIAAHKTGGAA